MTRLLTVLGLLTVLYTVQTNAQTTIAMDHYHAERYCKSLGERLPDLKDVEQIKNQKPASKDLADWFWTSYVYSDRDFAMVADNTSGQTNFLNRLRPLYVRCLQ